MTAASVAADLSAAPRQVILLPEQRRQLLFQVLSARGTISNRQARELLGVSAPTVARYLDELARRGLARRVRGGAAVQPTVRAAQAMNPPAPCEGPAMSRDPSRSDADGFVRTARRAAWNGYCADPFVLRTPNGYVMYGTSPTISRSGRVFRTLYSEDLDTWQPVDAALEATAGEPSNTSYWAPEVAYDDDMYWMYYSRGLATGTVDEGHHVRVATSTDPLGPFVDAGVNLTPELRFAIDASPFRDTNGDWWLYYATDVLDGPRPGTAIAVQRLRTMTAVDDRPRIVIRPNADWQRYGSARHIYDGTYDWHTVEGPHVVRRNEKYWMFYSGGNWRTDGYGVAVAVADHPAGPWHTVHDNPSVVSSSRSHLIGPGHSSVVTDPTGADHLVFHAFDPQRYIRQPYIVPLLWNDDGPSLLLAR